MVYCKCQKDLPVLDSWIGEDHAISPLLQVITPIDNSKMRSQTVRHRWALRGKKDSDNSSRFTSGPAWHITGPQYPCKCKVNLAGWKFWTARSAADTRLGLGSRGLEVELSSEMRTDSRVALDGCLFQLRIKMKMSSYSLQFKVVETQSGIWKPASSTWETERTTLWKARCEPLSETEKGGKRSLALKTTPFDCAMVNPAFSVLHEWSTDVRQIKVYRPKLVLIVV